MPSSVEVICDNTFPWYTYFSQNQSSGMFPSMSVNVSMSMNVGMPPVMGPGGQCGGAAGQDPQWGSMGHPHQPSPATASGQYSPGGSGSAQNINGQVSLEQKPLNTSRPWMREKCKLVKNKSQVFHFYFQVKSKNGKFLFFLNCICGNMESPIIKKLYQSIDVLFLL